MLLCPPAVTVRVVPVQLKVVPWLAGTGTDISAKTAEQVTDTVDWGSDSCRHSRTQLQEAAVGL